MRDLCALEVLTNQLKGAWQEDFDELSEVFLEAAGGSSTATTRAPNATTTSTPTSNPYTRAGIPDAVSNLSDYVREAAAAESHPVLHLGFWICD